MIKTFKKCFKEHDDRSLTEEIRHIEDIIGRLSDGAVTSVTATTLPGIEETTLPTWSTSTSSDIYHTGRGYLIDIPNIENVLETLHANGLGQANLREIVDMYIRAKGRMEEADG